MNQFELRKKPVDQKLKLIFEYLKDSNNVKIDFLDPSGNYRIYLSSDRLDQSKSSLLKFEIVFLHLLNNGQYIKTRYSYDEKLNLLHSNVNLEDSATELLTDSKEVFFQEGPFSKASLTGGAEDTREYFFQEEPLDTLPQVPDAFISLVNYSAPPIDDIINLVLTYGKFKEFYILVEQLEFDLVVQDVDIAFKLVDSFVKLNIEKINLDLSTKKIFIELVNNSVQFRILDRKGYLLGGNPMVSVYKYSVDGVLLDSYFYEDFQAEKMQTTIPLSNYADDIFKAFNYYRMFNKLRR